MQKNNPGDGDTRRLASRPPNAFVKFLMILLNGFGNIVSPIKKEEDKSKRRR